MVAVIFRDAGALMASGSIGDGLVQVAAAGLGGAAFALALSWLYGAFVR